MSAIRNIWKEANINLDRKSRKTGPLEILREQSNAINSDSDKTNIYSVVMSLSVTSNDIVDEVKHVLYLFPKNGNDYNYRLIEVLTRPDNNYPLKVNAFQSGHVDFGKCNSEDEFYVALSRIFNDPRLKIVFEQLRNIGDTIESWRK